MIQKLSTLPNAVCVCIHTHTTLQSYDSQNCNKNSENFMLLLAKTSKINTKAVLNNFLSPLSIPFVYTVIRMIKSVHHSL